MATAIFRVETTGKPDPVVDTYGARMRKVWPEVSLSDGTKFIDFQVLPSSVQDKSKDAEYDGHINRNIRLAMALIDMTKPYILIERIISIKVEGNDMLQIEFKLNGCIDVQEVFFTRNGVKETIDSTDAYCNYNLPAGQEQSIFKLTALPTDEVILQAVVDQEWCESIDEDKVGPSEFRNDP